MHSFFGGFAPNLPIRWKLLKFILYLPVSSLLPLFQELYSNSTHYSFLNNKYFQGYIKETKLNDHQIEGKQGKYSKWGALKKLMNKLGGDY